MRKNHDEIELILKEAGAYNLRNEVDVMARNIYMSLKKYGVVNDFSNLRIYQEAYRTCITQPEEQGHK